MKKGRLLVISIIVLALAYLAMQFEIREVPDIKYNLNYNYNSEQPYGLSIFKKMLHRRYGADRVKFINNIDSLPKHNEDSSMLIYLAEFISLDEDQFDAIDEFTQYGGKVLLGGESIFEYADKKLNRIANETFEDASVNIGINGKLYPFTDRYKSEDTSINVLTASEFDFFVEDYFEDSEDTVTQYKIDSSLLYKIDTLLMAGQIPTAKEFDDVLILHGYPILFTNIGASQSYYVPHFDQIFHYPNVKRIYVIQSGTISSDKTLFKIIMSERGLRYALFTLLGACLLMFLINTKRIQPTMPLKAAYVNRTIGYLNTLSQLYQNADKPLKLAFQMKANFYQFLYKEFGLKENNPQFVKLLSQKAKVKEQLIQQIVNELNKYSNGVYFDPVKLIDTHNKITQFKDQIYGNRRTRRGKESDR